MRPSSHPPPVPVPDTDQVLLKQCRVDTFRSGGKGGQHANTADSGVRLTHEPTGVTAVSRSERSQHRNKSVALARLRMKLERRNARQPAPRAHRRSGGREAQALGGEAPPESPQAPAKQAAPGGLTGRARLRPLARHAFARGGSSPPTVGEKSAAPRVRRRRIGLLRARPDTRFGGVGAARVRILDRASPETPTPPSARVTARRPRRRPRRAAARVGCRLRSTPATPAAPWRRAPAVASHRAPPTRPARTPSRPG